MTGFEDLGDRCENMDSRSMSLNFIVPFQGCIQFVFLLRRLYHERKKIGVSMFTSIGVINLTEV